MIGHTTLLLEPPKLPAGTDFWLPAPWNTNHHKHISIYQLHLWNYVLTFPYHFQENTRKEISAPIENSQGSTNETSTFLAPAPENLVDPRN